MKKRSYFTTINIVNNAAIQTVKFNDDSSLLNKKIIAIDVFSVAQVSVGPAGETIISAADLIKCFFSFKRENDIKIDKIPAVALNPILNYGIKLDFSSQPFQWNQSFCTVGANVATCSIPVIVYFEE